MKCYAVLLITVIISFLSGCNSTETSHSREASGAIMNMLPVSNSDTMELIAQIPLPVGYERMNLQDNSFSNWIRNLPLRKKNVVYLYNGKPKANQHDNYAVVDISTGSRDLQQCADALMRLRAEYFFSIKDYQAINFRTVDGKEVSFSKYAKGERYALVGQKLMNHSIGNVQPEYSHKCLMQFLNVVFNYCSTYTLQAMCAPKQLSAMMPGDMFVKAGSPGHAMMIADVAVNNKTGKKIYLLLQGYLPAQDIHIVRNPMNTSLSPWYEENTNTHVITPGWTFKRDELRMW